MNTGRVLFYDIGMRKDITKRYQSSQYWYENRCRGSQFWYAESYRFSCFGKKNGIHFHDLNIEQIYPSVYLCAMSFDVGDYVSPSPSIL